jgi:REP element-mobilizing transposase RayT
MARAHRLQTPGYLRHVISRGNGRMQIFLSDGDYRKFLYILGDVVQEYDVECWDFCLIPNHYHLSIRTRRPNLSKALQHLNGEYGSWWNAAHAKVGHVFQGRFKDQIVQREEYLETLLRYIALNPVRAKLVTHPADWPWSGYRYLAGLSPDPGFMTAEHIHQHLAGPAVSSGIDGYKRHITRETDDTIKFERLRSKERVIGDRPFKRSVLTMPCELSQPTASALVAHSSSAPTEDDGSPRAALIG